MPNEKRYSFLQILCELSPWIVFVHRVLSGNCKAVDKYDVRSDDAGLGDDIQVDDYMGLLVTPWKTDDDHDECVEGLLTDYPVDHFPHTEKRNISEFVCRKNGLNFKAKSEEMQKKLSRCRTSSVCHMSLTQNAVKANWGKKTFEVHSTAAKYENASFGWWRKMATNEPMEIKRRSKKCEEVELHVS